ADAAVGDGEADVAGDHDVAAGLAVGVDRDAVGPRGVRPVPAAGDEVVGDRDVAAAVDQDAGVPAVGDVQAPDADLGGAPDEDGAAAGAARLGGLEAVDAEVLDDDPRGAAREHEQAGRAGPG